MEKLIFNEGLCLKEINGVSSTLFTLDCSKKSLPPLLRKTCSYAVKILLSSKRKKKKKTQPCFYSSTVAV